MHCLAQMARQTKNSREEELSREELLKVLGNLQLYQYMRLFEVADSTGNYLDIVSNSLSVVFTS